MKGGQEAFLPVEHITPHADASTNGVRSIARTSFTMPRQGVGNGREVQFLSSTSGDPVQVTQSSKGGRLRVREIGAGRVSMLTPNEEALRCKARGGVV